MIPCSISPSSKTDPVARASIVKTSASLIWTILTVWYLTAPNFEARQAELELDVYVSSRCSTCTRFIDNLAKHSDFHRIKIVRLFLRGENSPSELMTDVRQWKCKVEIIPDPSWSYFHKIAESGIPRMRLTRNGALIHEWVGSSRWTSDDIIDLAERIPHD